MFVHGLAVEPTEAPFVAGEVRRHPVEDHADAAPVQHVDEATEPVGVAETGRRRVVPRHLIPPGSTEGVLGDRHQLDMGEAEPDDMVADLLGECVPGVHTAFPTREMHFVDP